MRRILMFLLFLSMIACGEESYYEQSFQIDEGQWYSDKTATFDFEIDDIERFYDLVLEIDHSVDYTYENVYVKIYTTFPSGEKVIDQVSLQVADEFDQWQGKCTGKGCTVSILLQENVFFKEKGSHQIEIEQFNRENPLQGIQGLKFKILEVE